MNRVAQSGETLAKRYITISIFRQGIYPCYLLDAFVTVDRLSSYEEGGRWRESVA